MSGRDAVPVDAALPDAEAASGPAGRVDGDRAARVGGTQHDPRDEPSAPAADARRAAVDGHPRATQLIAARVAQPDDEVPAGCTGRRLEAATARAKVQGDRAGPTIGDEQQPRAAYPPRR